MANEFIIKNGVKIEGETTSISSIKNTIRASGADNNTIIPELGIKTALDTKEPVITTGTAQQVIRGNKGLLNLVDSNDKIVTDRLPDAVLGAVKYQGVWNANTNNPPIPLASNANKGWYYICNTAGTHDSISYDVGDWIISSGTAWSKVDNVDDVKSVNGKIGIVVLDKADVGLDQVDNTSDANKPVSTATQTAIDNARGYLVKSGNGYVLRGIPPRNLDALPLGENAVEFAWGLSAGRGASGLNSFSAGANHKVSNNFGVALGSEMLLSSTLPGAVAVGRFGEDVTDPTQQFTVGVGTANNNRKNGLVVYTDGSVTAPTATPAVIAARGNKALVTEERLQGQMDTALSGKANTVHTHAIGDTTGLQTALDGKVGTGDSRLTNSREWTADTVTQSEAETGTATTRRAWTAQRVRQAITAWWGTVSSSLSVAWANITGKPTTVSGYGITDAYTKTQVDTSLAGKAPVNHAVADTTYGVSGDNGVFGHTTPSMESPLMDGVASRGINQATFARGDHRHPTDTSRAPVSHTHNELTGNNYTIDVVKPSFFGAGKVRAQMLSNIQLGISSTWSLYDMLWVNAYTGADVKGTGALIFGKTTEFLGFAKQDYDATSWGTVRTIWHSGNFDPALKQNKHSNLDMLSSQLFEITNPTPFIQFRMLNEGTITADSANRIACNAIHDGNGGYKSGSNNPGTLLTMRSFDTTTALSLYSAPAVPAGTVQTLTEVAKIQRNGVIISNATPAQIQAAGVKAVVTVEMLSTLPVGGDDQQEGAILQMWKYRSSDTKYKPRWFKGLQGINYQPSSGGVHSYYTSVDPLECHLTHQDLGGGGGSPTISGFSRVSWVSGLTVTKNHSTWGIDDPITVFDSEGQYGQVYSTPSATVEDIDNASNKALIHKEWADAKKQDKLPSGTNGQVLTLVSGTPVWASTNLKGTIETGTAGAPATDYTYTVAIAGATTSMCAHAYLSGAGSRGFDNYSIINAIVTAANTVTVYIRMSTAGSIAPNTIINVRVFP